MSPTGVPQKLPVIAIDGASGAGKGTLTSRLADALGYTMLDSGALYRIVGLSAAQAGLLNDTPLDEQALARLARSLDITFLPPQAGSEHISVWVNGQDVSRDIRSEQVGAYASQVAVFGEVRAALLALQQNMALAGDKNYRGVVADGRDMGTVVFPDAALKIFLVASPQARAERRVKQLQAAGQEADFATVLENLIARDARDSARAVAPAKPADDAIVLDSSTLDADAVFAHVWQLCLARGLAPADAKSSHSHQI